MTAAERERLAQAEQWWQFQTRRLGVTREEIDAAIRRGWCGDQIAGLLAHQVDELAGPPPLDAELAAAKARLAMAHVEPIRDAKAMDRARRNVHNH